MWHVFHARAEDISLAAEVVAQLGAFVRQHFAPN